MRREARRKLDREHKDQSVDAVKVTDDSYKSKY